MVAKGELQNYLGGITA